MAAASFGAYILHAAIVVAQQTTITDLILSAFAKFALVSAPGTAIAFGAARMASQIPGIRVVLAEASALEAIRFTL